MNTTLRMSDRDNRHCGYDNCKSVFIFYVVLFHAMNNWYLEESTKDWPPFWSDFFKSYTLWHEKLAVPGFAFVSGFFGKHFTALDGSDRWKSTISVLFVGSLYVQLCVAVMEYIMKVLLKREGEIPATITFWDNLETWYLLALLLWRFTTPFLELLNRPLLFSIGLAFMHVHVAYGEPSELRMRLFRYFPYYVMGLSTSNVALDKLPRPRILGTLGVTMTFFFCWVISEKTKYLSLTYTGISWSWEPHFILLLQYVLSALLVLSVILLVRQISYPLFPFFHSQSTLAIYSWHWFVLPPILWGKYPFSDIEIYHGRPLMELLQRWRDHPMIAIILLHVTSYTICALLGSKFAWNMLRHISDPNCEWMFRNAFAKEQSLSRKTTRNDLVVGPCDNTFAVFHSEAETSSGLRCSLRRSHEEICNLV